MANFVFLLVGDAGQQLHRPDGAVAWNPVPSRPAEFSIVLSNPQEATVGASPATVTLLASQPSE